MQRKKLLRIAGITVLVTGILALSAHLFVVYRAKQILNYIVLQASHDSYMVKGGKVRFRYNPLSINAKSLEVVPVDSVNGKTFYISSADSVSIQVTKLWALLFNKNYSLENVHIIRPVIRVYDKDTTARLRKPLNEALGDIQHGLMSALTDFSIRNCRIDDAAITYVQNKKDLRPIHVNHIWLNLRNVSAVPHQDIEDSIVSYTADINLEVRKPFVQFPDPDVDVYLDNLLLDTRKNVFAINNLTVYNHNQVGTTDSVKLSEIRLTHFNWNRWLKDGLIEIDSLKANNGATFFDFSGKQLAFKDRGKFGSGGKSGMINFLLHSVEVKKINYSLKIGSEQGPLNMQLNGDSLAAGDISFSKDSLRPLKVGSVAVKVTDFINTKDNNRNNSTFEKLVIDHNDLQLVNFHRNLDFKNVAAGNSITIPSLRVVNFSLDDLLQYKLVADKLILEKPSLVIDAQKKRDHRNPDEAIASVMNAVRPSLAIKKLSIVDAAIELSTGADNSGRIRIEELNTEFNAEKLLRSSSVLDLISSASALSSNGFRINGPNINLFVKRSIVNGGNRGVFLEHMEGNIGPSLNVNLDGVYLNNDKSRIDISNLGNIPLDNVRINSGSVTLQMNRSGNGSKQVKTPSFFIGNISTGPLHLHIAGSKADISISDIRAKGYNISTGNKMVKWDLLNLQSGKLVFKSDRLNVNASGLESYQPGNTSINDLQVDFNDASVIKKLAIPTIIIATNFKSGKDVKLESELVRIENPSLDITINKKNGISDRPVVLPQVYIKRLIVNDPIYNFSVISEKQNQLFKGTKGSLDIRDFNTNNLIREIHASSLGLHLSDPFIESGSVILKPASVKLDASEIFYNAGKRSVAAIIDTALIAGLDFKWNNKVNASLVNATAGVSSFIYSSADSFSVIKFLKKSNWWAAANAFNAETKSHTIQLFNPYLQSESLFRFDSLQVLPRMSRDSFWHSFPFEKAYNTLRIGATFIKNWNLVNSSLKEIHIQNVDADAVDMVSEKDKTRGPDTTKYRPLLARSFEKIPFRFVVDNIHVTNGKVRHNLISEKTKKEGSIYFNGIEGNIYNLKNYGISDADTLRFRLAAKLMGEGNMVVGFSQSYKDSLQGFSLKAKMNRFNLYSLNSMLIPVISLKVEKGIADSLLLSVGANDYVAYGTMDMRYHGLKISLLKKGERKYFLSSFFNGVANALIRSSNNANKNIVYVERLRNKATFNFWGHIAINGLLSNLGVKRDKMQNRKYNKAVKRGIVPPVDESLF